MAFGITDLKKGTLFKLEDHPYKVLDYSQKVMGRGGSIVNVRITTSQVMNTASEILVYGTAVKFS